jgi:hypothetical protein
MLESRLIMNDGTDTHSKTSNLFCISTTCGMHRGFCGSPSEVQHRRKARNCLRN